MLRKVKDSNLLLLVWGEANVSKLCDFNAVRRSLKKNFPRTVFEAIGSCVRSAASLKPFDCRCTKHINVANLLHMPSRVKLNKLCVKEIV
jgi:hypothetical protein